MRPSAAQHSVAQFQARRRPAAAHMLHMAPPCPAQAVWMFSRRACLELTHNWGTEADESFTGYHNGNSDPRGYGHIGSVQ
jgi:hypothetical protein